MAEIDCLNRLNSTLLRSAVLLTVAIAIFFLASSLFQCKTILVSRRMKNPPRVKLDQLEWREWPCWRRFMQGWAVAFLFLQLFPDQSINQSIDRTITNWKRLREFTSELLPTVFIWRKPMFWCYVLRSGYLRIYVRSIKERKWLTGAERSALIYGNFVGEWNVWIEIQSHDRPKWERRL